MTTTMFSLDWIECESWPLWKVTDLERLQQRVDDSPFIAARVQVRLRQLRESEVHNADLTDVAADDSTHMRGESKHDFSGAESKV